MTAFEQEAPPPEVAEDKQHNMREALMVGDEESERQSRLSHSSVYSTMNHPTNSAILTTFLLLNSMIGSGILNQPYVFRESGILGAVIAFIIAALGTFTGLLCLTAAGIETNILEYSGLANKAFPGQGDRIVDISIIILAFGAQLGYILIVGTTLSTLLTSWGCNSVMCGDYSLTIISVVTLVTPVCMFRHFGHLAYLSLFSIVAIVSVLLLVLIGGPIKHNMDHVTNDYSVISGTGTIASTGSIVFSLSCAAANFQAFISTEKKAQTMEGWTKVTGTAVFAGMLMCCTMGLVGYLSFAGDTQGMILDNFPQVGYDVFRCLVVTHLILYIPVNFVIMRYSLVKITTGKRSEHLPFATHTALTVGLLAFITGVVILLLAVGLASGTAFSLILNITGGIGGSLANFIIPGGIYLKIMPTTGSLYRPAQALVLLGVYVMFSVVIITIIEAM